MSSEQVRINSGLKNGLVTFARSTSLLCKFITHAITQEFNGLPFSYKYTIGAGPFNWTSQAAKPPPPPRLEATLLRT